VLKVIVQPGSALMRDALEDLAVSANGGSCRALTAWLTPGGLSLANDFLTRHRVGFSELIVGINRSGTSARDLRVALAVLSQSGGTLRYYLDGKLAGPIYHPKVWFMESPCFRGALVGSANLTREGLLDNVEAAVILADGGAAHRNEASAAIDDLKAYLDSLSASPYSTLVDEEVIGHLLEIAAIPEKTDRRRNDLDQGAVETTTSDDRIAVRTPRVRSLYQPATPLPALPTIGEASAGAVVAVPNGVRLRYIRYYGLGESNRVRKYQEQYAIGQRPSAGTFEQNVTMVSDAEKQLWGFPKKFVTNQDGTAREWNPRVRLITVRDGRTIETIISAGRLWKRIRDERESEARFRFTSTAAVRDAFPTDINELTLFVVDPVDDGTVDYEVRLIGRNDPGYSASLPTGDRDYEYRIV
jgi:hypothetical protein